MKYLCLVINRVTKTQLAEYKIEEVDKYEACNQAVDIFNYSQNQSYMHKQASGSWYIDAMEI